MAKKNNNPQPVRATLTKILPSRLLPKAEIPLTETATELKDLGISESRIINLKDPRKIRRTTGAPLKPTERKGGPIPVDIVKDIAAYSKKYNVDPVEALGRAIVESQGRGWEYNNIFHILDNPIKNPAMTKLLRNYRSGTEAGIIAIKQKAQEFDNLVKRGKISKSHSPEKLNMLKLQMYNGLGLLTPDVEGAKGSLYGVKIPKEGLKMTERPLYAEELLDAMYMIRANPEVLDIIKNTKPAENTSQLGPLKNQNYTNYESAPLFDKGGLIKRKDGSYSRRGLWDNIRANRGSGRKPTAEMLRQERKIKAQKKEDGGWLDQYDDGSWVMDGAIPTPTTPSYYPAYPDRTLTTRQMGTPKAPMYAAGATVWTNQNTPLWAAGTPTPTSTQANYKNSRAISPESAIPYPEVTYPKSARYFTQAPVMQGYNPYSGPMRLHAPDTTRMGQGGKVTSDYKKRAGIPYAISPGISDAGMYVGPTTQRGITFADGGLTGEEGQNNNFKSYSSDPEYFNSHAVYHDNSNYNDQIKRLVYAGTHEYNPSTGELRKLKKPVKVPADTQQMATKEYTEGVRRDPTDPRFAGADARTKRIIEQSTNEAYQNPLMYAPGMIGMSILPGGLQSAIGLSSGAANIGAGNYKTGALEMGLSALPFMPRIPKINNLASEATAGLSDYVKGLKIINAVKPTFSTKYLNRLLIARSPKTTKALGQLDPSVAKEMIYSYNPKIKTLDWNEVPDDTYYTTLKDFRVNLKKAKREVDKIKKEDPTFSFSSNDYNVLPFFERPENVKKYYDRVKLMEKTYDSQKKFISYLNNKYKDRMDLINQNSLFKNIAEESPQYTDIIYEHLKNPKTTDDEFLNNLIKQANTFTRSLGEDVSPDEFFTLRGRSFTTGNNNTIDVEGFPVSGDYGDFRYKIEPTSERMSEIGKYPIKERWSKRFPETFSEANPNITTNEGMYSTLNPEYGQWYWTRQKKNKSTGLGAPTIKYNFPEDVPLKYYYFPQHSVFNTSLADQSLKGFNVSKINIPRREAYEYLPGFTRGFAQGGPIYNWIPNYPRVGVQQYNKKQSGGWLDNL